uniref:Cell division cycle protein 123 homolog n=1 Tax=Caligus rogercresseyi TaxID=217165 RepID=C1BPJ7_CALRO|nr:Cell division cycle protein 123 homolog [Caligus rogercresseyi]
MLISEVQACDISSWYESYKDLTYPTTLLPLPKAVLEYLKEDSSLILPSECDSEGYFDQNSSDSECELEDEGSEEGPRPSFPEFSTALQEVLKQGTGKFFIKLNWSSPRDAHWVSSSGLLCKTLTDVYLLLKSSHFILHDLTNPFKDCQKNSEEEKNAALQGSQYVLALREWSSINPGHEFRCFVRGGNLIGISQRDPTSFYDYILRQETSIKRSILNFFESHLWDFPLQSFVFDVVSSSKGGITLMDFNPFGPTTDGLLFEWEELLNYEEGTELSEVEFRCIREERGIRSDTIRMYSLPTDVIDIANGTDHDKLISFLELQAEMQNKKT